MDLDQQKNDWKDFSLPEGWGEQPIQAYWLPPSLQAMRDQLLVETCCGVAFLAVYYTAFDGYLSSLGWNLALILGFFVLILHNLLGYQMSKVSIGTAPLSVTINQQLRKIKSFRWWSLGLRTLVLLLFFGFISSRLPLEVLLARKFPYIGGLLITLTVMIYFQLRIWNKRIHRLENHLNGMN